MSATAPLDRRARRRQESLEEILDLAAEIMTEQGVAGLSVGEIARRMGIRPPSLYVYFPSKNALYDALFARGAELLVATMEGHAAQADESAPLADQLLAAARRFIEWCVAHPSYSQLMFWRPVPGFIPTAAAYEPAIRLMALTTAWFERLQEHGALRADVPVDDIVRDWTVVTAGVVSQQLANAPDEQPERGRFLAALPGLAAMFASHYATPQPSARARGRARHGNQG